MDACAVPTGDVAIDNDAVWTCGMNTCMFLCVQTKNAVVGWHFSWENTQGFNMRRVKALLNTVKDVQHAYLVPGADRQRDLSLKPECRTMRLHTHVDPTASFRFFADFIRQYPWHDKIIVTSPLQHYKIFVQYSKRLSRPTFARDDAAFDKICYVDGEKQT